MVRMMIQSLYYLRERRPSCALSDTIKLCGWTGSRDSLSYSTNQRMPISACRTDKNVPCKACSLHASRRPQQRGKHMREWVVDCPTTMRSEAEGHGSRTEDTENLPCHDGRMAKSNREPIPEVEHSRKSSESYYEC